MLFMDYIELIRRPIVYSYIIIPYSYSFTLFNIEDLKDSIF